MSICTEYNTLVRATRPVLSGDDIMWEFLRRTVTLILLYAGISAFLASPGPFAAVERRESSPAEAPLLAPEAAGAVERLYPTLPEHDGVRYARLEDLSLPADGRTPGTVHWAAAKDGRSSFSVTPLSWNASRGLPSTISMPLRRWSWIPVLLAGGTYFFLPAKRKDPRGIRYDRTSCMLVPDLIIYYTLVGFYFPPVLVAALSGPESPFARSNLGTTLPFLIPGFFLFFFFLLSAGYASFEVVPEEGALRWRRLGGSGVTPMKDVTSVTVKDRQGLPLPEGTKSLVSLLPGLLKMLGSLLTFRVNTVPYLTVRGPGGRKLFSVWLNSLEKGGAERLLGVLRANGLLGDGDGQSAPKREAFDEKMWL